MKKQITYGKKHFTNHIQVDLRDTAGLVPEKAHITANIHMNFWLPSAYQSYVYTIL